MAKKKLTFRLHTNDEGRIEDTRNPAASKDLITALLVLAEWGDRKKEDIVDEPMFKRMFAATRRFVRSAKKYREEFEASKD